VDAPAITISFCTRFAKSTTSAELLKASFALFPNFATTADISANEPLASCADAYTRLNKSDVLFKFPPTDSKPLFIISRRAVIAVSSSDVSRTFFNVCTVATVASIPAAFLNAFSNPPAELLAFSVCSCISCILLFDLSNSSCIS